MGSLVVLIRDVDQKRTTFHLKVAHVLSTINTDTLVFLPGPKPFRTNCIRATRILASHTSISIQVNITDPAKHTHIANEAYTDISEVRSHCMMRLLIMVLRAAIFSRRFHRNKLFSCVLLFLRCQGYSLFEKRYKCFAPASI